MNANMNKILEKNELKYLNFLNAQNLKLKKKL